MKRFLSILMIAGIALGILSSVTVAFAGSAWGPSPETRSKTKAPNTPSPGPNQENMKALTQKLMNDPESMALIENLKKDPAMQKILNDPELLKAVQQRDLGRIAQDPNVQALEKNPNLQKLLQKSQ